MRFIKVQGKWHINFCAGKYSKRIDPPITQEWKDFCDAINGCSNCPIHNEWLFVKTYGKVEEDSFNLPDDIALEVFKKFLK